MTSGKAPTYGYRFRFQDPTGQYSCLDSHSRGQTSDRVVSLINLPSDVAYQHSKGHTVKSVNPFLCRSRARHRPETLGHKLRGPPEDLPCPDDSDRSPSRNGVIAHFGVDRVLKEGKKHKSVNRRSINLIAETPAGPDPWARPEHGEKAEFEHSKRQHVHITMPNVLYLSQVTLGMDHLPIVARLTIYQSSLTLHAPEVT